MSNANSQIKVRRDPDLDAVMRIAMNYCKQHNMYNVMKATFEARKNSNG